MVRKRTKASPNGNQQPVTTTKQAIASSPADSALSDSALSDSALLDSALLDNRSNNMLSDHTCSDSASSNTASAESENDAGYTSAKTVDTVYVVDAVIDRRDLDPDKPQPIHPMDVVIQQMGNASMDNNDTKAVGDAQNSDAHSVVLVEAIAMAADEPFSDQSAQSKHDGSAMEKPETTPEATIFSDLVVDELNAAIASAHQHEAELDAHLTAIDHQQDQLRQQLTQAQTEITILQQQLTDTQHQELNLKQQVVGLQTECDRTIAQLQQCQTQLTHQANLQQEINTLKTQITDLTTELGDAKRYIVQLIETSAPITSPQATVTNRRSTAGSPRQKPPLFPSPMVPSLSSRSLPNSQSQSFSKYQLAKGLTGLPPMSTERLNGLGVNRSQPSQPISPSSERLRPAYTRPGFANAAPPPLPSGREPMPRLQATSHRTSSQATPLPPQASSNSSGSLSRGTGAAIVSQRQDSKMQQRSRSHHEIQPHLQSSDLPKPKVSDAEIGWFD